MFACCTILRFCPHGTQLLGACGVGVRTHLARDVMMRDLVISVPLARNRHPSDAECVGGHRQERFRFNPANANATSHAVSRGTLFTSFFVLVTKIRKTTRRSMTRPQSHTAHDVEKNLDYAGAVVCDSMHACSHLYVGMGGRCSRTLQGEHLPHRTVSRQKQSGGTPVRLHLQTPCRQRF